MVLNIFVAKSSSETEPDVVEFAPFDFNPAAPRGHDLVHSSVTQERHLSGLLRVSIAPREKIPGNFYIDF